MISSFVQLCFKYLSNTVTSPSLSRKPTGNSLATGLQINKHTYIRSWKKTAQNGDEGWQE